MWECSKCHERHEDSFEVCWNCGTSKAGKAGLPQPEKFDQVIQSWDLSDPSFRPADEMDSASLWDRDEETAIAAGSPPPKATAEAPDYSFSPQQMRLIAGLAFSMRFVGVITLLAGIFLLVLASLVGAGLLAFVQGIVPLVIGGMTFYTAGEFDRIVNSRRNHIGRLMSALFALRILYRFQMILICVALIILVMALAKIVAQ